MEISGKDLKVGDTIEVWWSPRRDTVVGFRPLTGEHAAVQAWLDTLHGEPLRYEQVRVAEFAINKLGMTIFDNDSFRLINRPGS